MSALKLFAALEEFQDEMEATLAPEAADPEAIDAASAEFQGESEAIDDDLSSIQSGAQALEDIISLVEEAPGAEDAPLEPFVQRAVNVAMEANDLVASSGNAVALTADKGETKKDFLDKAKDFVKKVWEMLSNMAAKIMQWIRGVWAKNTDRLVKNANKAKKNLDIIKGINTRPDAKIDNERLLKAVANAEGSDVGDIIVGVFEHAQNQSEKAAKQIAHEAALLVESIAGGKNNNDTLIDKFVELLSDGAGAFTEKATPAQAQAAGAAASTTVLVSAPFFGGNRAWLAAPDNREALGLWNHGVSVLDKPKAIKDAAPDVRELQSICEYVITGQDLVRLYQVAAKDLDVIHQKLQVASKKTGEGVDKGLVKQMQSVIPRIIKGPQVAAYNYAATASSIALAYVEAALAAHQKSPDEDKAPKADAEA